MSNSPGYCQSFLLPAVHDFDILVSRIQTGIMVKDPYARIIRVEKENSYCLLSLFSPSIAGQAKPGQFIMIRVSSLSHPLLRRPFSLHAVDKDCVEVFFQKQGLGTELLSEKKEKETLDILGPLGRSFSLESGMKAKTAVLVGGGRGMAPLYFLGKRLAESGTDIKMFYGGKTSSDLPLRVKCENNGFDISCSTDDGSFGFKGLISTLFSREIKKTGPAMVFSCGPEAMMREIARVCREEEIPAEFSLESIMGCGFGACWGCVKRIRRNNKEEWVKICEDGPIFPLDSILWDEEQS